MLISIDGNQEELACFVPDSTTEAYFSCSINWKNQLCIFGGYTQTRQISRFSKSRSSFYKLERLADLPFDHNRGTCSVIGNQFVFLCFDSNDANQCRRSTGPLEHFSVVTPSTHRHQGARTSYSDSKFFAFTPVIYGSSSCTGRGWRPVKQKKREI